MAILLLERYETSPMRKLIQLEPQPFLGKTWLYATALYTVDISAQLLEDKVNRNSNL